MVDIGLQVYRIDPFEFAFIVEYSSKMAKSFYWICKPPAAAIELCCGKAITTSSLSTSTSPLLQFTSGEGKYIDSSLELLSSFESYC